MFCHLLQVAPLDITKANEHLFGVFDPPAPQLEIKAIPTGTALASEDFPSADADCDLLTNTLAPLLEPSTPPQAEDLQEAAENNFEDAEQEPPAEDDDEEEEWYEACDHQESEAEDEPTSNDSSEAAQGEAGPDECGPETVDQLPEDSTAQESSDAQGSNADQQPNPNSFNQENASAPETDDQVADKVLEEEAEGEVADSPAPEEEDAQQEGAPASDAEEQPDPKAIDQEKTPAKVAAPPAAAPPKPRKRTAEVLEELEDDAPTEVTRVVTRNRAKANKIELLGLYEPPKRARKRPSDPTGAPAKVVKEGPKNKRGRKTKVRPVSQSPRALQANGQPVERRKRKHWQPDPDDILPGDRLSNKRHAFDEAKQAIGFCLRRGANMALYHRH
ncbi:S-antigen protein-like [Neocloeon triangulifer]|uniref:S-antigen protein-like n=1 Tax=Neocloeon triangulifer TaxID=2078957 RepID=UPI00286F0385|nr:S-antigen protein-like [Neocloeon triangulifer]